jgi:AraC-like DNA-binding protein
VDPRIESVLRMIRDEPGREFELETLAQTANISVSHLRHLFKSQTGITPTKFIKQVRMENAEQLLRTTFLSVKEIMNRVGIPNQSYFSREFKKMYGLAPNEYRRSDHSRS